MRGNIIALKIVKHAGASVKDVLNILKVAVKDDDEAVIVVLPVNQGRLAGAVRRAKSQGSKVRLESCSNKSMEPRLRELTEELVCLVEEWHVLYEK